MKKRKKGGSALSRTKDQRDALMNTLLVSLMRYQSIKTTLTKAKQLRPFAEKMMTHAKEAAINPEKKVVKLRLLSQNLPTEYANKMIKQAELFKDRQGGYVRIVKLPNRRSDASSMAMIEWVQKLAMEEKAKKEKPAAKEKQAVKAEKKETKKEPEKAEEKK